MYADYYNGVCIGYNTHFIEKSENKEVYNDKFELVVKIPNIKQSGIIFKKFPYGYVELKRIDYNNVGQYSYNWISRKLYENGKSILGGTCNKDEENKIFGILNRSKDSWWCTQKEWRALYQVLDTSKDISKIEYPDEILISVTFGYKMPSEQKEEIYFLIKRNYSNFYQIEFKVAKPDFFQIQFDSYIVGM